jgi:glycerol-3-phosphate acyltransferase PlsY
MTILLFFAAFLLGSIPTGLIIARGKGIDLKKVGSGNIGATNVMRAAGKKEALFTLLGDIGKGLLSVAIAQALPRFGFSASEILPMSISTNPQAAFEGLLGLAAILGHNFSVFLRFKGGKGVATSLGVVLAYSPAAGLFTAVLWLLTALWTKYSSLSALVAFGLLPISIYALDPSPVKEAVAVVIAALIFFRHAANIKRLMQRTEDKIGLKG